MLIIPGQSKKEASILLKVNFDQTIEELRDEEVIRKGNVDDDKNKELSRSTLLYNFPSVWSKASGEDVKIAIIDTGIDITHAAFGVDVSQVNEPRFQSSVIDRATSVLNGIVNVVIEKGKLAENKNREDLDLVRDINGHGTHCAGIVCARPLNEEFVPYEPAIGTVVDRGSSQQRETEWRASDGFDGSARRFDELAVKFSGVAPRAKLLVYKITNDENIVDEDTGFEEVRSEALVDDLALAINCAVDDGADIISISMEAAEGTRQLYKAVHRTLALGRKIVVAAGNQGTLRTNGIGYPAHYGGVITVASHGPFGRQSAFTSQGGEIDLGAPGELIWSTWKGRSYTRRTGTSMAAPFIAGIAGLMLSAQPNPSNPTIRNNEELRQQLLNLTTHRGLYDPAQLGYGAVSVGDYAGRESIVR